MGIRERVAERLDIKTGEVGIPDCLEWVGRSPAYAPIVTLAITSLGVIASLYPSEIQESFLNVGWISDPLFSQIGTTFWGLVALSAFLFWGRRAAEDRASKREREKRRQLLEVQEKATRDLKDSVEEETSTLQSELEDATNTLEKNLANVIDDVRRDLRSMPPNSFLNEYKKVFKKVEEISRTGYQVLQDGNAGYDNQREALLVAIQAALGGIADLARLFDEADERERYAANVLIYIPTSLISPSTYPAIDDRLMHVNTDVSVRGLRGVLDFRQELSVVVEGDTEQPDQDHPDVAFGIPNEIEYQPESASTSSFRIGPGAPVALTKGDPGIFADTDQIEEWIREKSTLGKEARDKTMAFIRGEGEPQIGSFISIPLMMTGKENDENADSRGELLDHEFSIGVINVHRESPNILRGRERSLEYFDATIFAINSRLSDLVGRLAELECERHGTWAHLV